MMQAPHSERSCRSCKEVKPLTSDFFHRRNDQAVGFNAQCKVCRSAKRKASYISNKSHELAVNRSWVVANKERKASRAKQLRESNIGYYRNKEKEQRKRYKAYMASYQRNYRKINRDIINAAQRERIATDIGFRIKRSLQSRILSTVTRGYKSKSTIALLSCSIEHLKDHLSRQFKPGMSWNNYGEWHIDHIKPCALFDLTDPDQQKKCFNYTNLQPLWASENCSKRHTYVEQKGCM